MARHTIQIPINKSSNDNVQGKYIYKKVRWDGQLDTTILDYEKVSIGMVSNKLCCLRDADRRILYGFGVAWDSSLIPTGKTIISAKLYLYTTVSKNRAIYYKYSDFNEGSAIPSYQPSDGAKSYGLSSGWDSIDMGILKGNSIVIYSALEFNFIANYVGDKEIGDITEYIGEYWEMYSHRNSTNKPYLEITYDDLPPKSPTSLYPDNITLNPRDIIRFAWEHNSEESTLQKGFTLQYKINAGSWVTVNQTTPNQFYDMPANTLPTTGTITWQVKTIDTNNSVSGYTVATFTLGIVPQKAPIAIAPISQYIDEKNNVKFEWNFTGGSSGETQSKFELQYSVDGGNTATTITRTTSDAFYILPKNILPSGNVLWTVRTYNNWNEVSPYSGNRSFTIIGSPPIPLITEITNSGKPTIKWQSQGQHLYKLQILQNNKIIFDSGTIPSTSDREYKLSIYLKDENYKVKLKIFNEFNLESPYAEKTFIISTVKPQQPLIEVYSMEYATTIKANDLSDTNLVYRDDILIGEINDNSFIDYTGENNKEYKYFIRAVDSTDNFADSKIELGHCSFSGNTLATLENPEEFIKLEYGFDEIPGKSNIVGSVGSLNYYDGREYPVAQYTEFKSMEKTLSFFVENKKRVDELRSLISKNKTLLYRDYEGENIKGTTFVLNDDETILGYNVGFTITKTEV